MRRVVAALCGGILLAGVAAYAQTPTPTPTPRTRQEVVTYEELRLQDMLRMVVYRDEDTGNIGVLLGFEMRRDVGGVERGQIEVQLTPAEKQQLKQWVEGTLLERANRQLGFEAAP